MFERYTETARRVIFSARFFASECGSRTIEPEHILLAIIREEPALFHPWLKCENDFQALRSTLENRAGEQEKTPDSINIPFSQQSKHVLAYASEEAERLHDPHIRSTHFLAALLRVPNTLAARALTGIGVELQQVRLVFVASLKQSYRPETEDLHLLVDQLPTAQLGPARVLLQALCRDQGGAGQA